MLRRGIPREQYRQAYLIAISGGVLADIDRRPLGGAHDRSLRVLLEHGPTLLERRPHLAVWWARLEGCTGVIRMVDQGVRIGGFSLILEPHKVHPLSGLRNRGQAP